MNVNNYIQIPFTFQEGKIVTINFNGGNITSDAGLLLIRQYDEKVKLIERATKFITDKRVPHLVVHQAVNLMCQRIYGIIGGYEDANDATYLCHDPTFLTITGNTNSSSLASQPTISRFENNVRAREVLLLDRFLLRHYINRQQKKGCDRSRIIIDVDSVDDPCHGMQQLAFFNGFYDQHMYYPLLFFDGESGDLLSVRLRPGNVHGSRCMVAALKRIVCELRRCLRPRAIIFRSDGGGAVPLVYTTAEGLGIDYLINLPRNPILEVRVERLVARARAVFQKRKKPVTYYTSFWYQAGSWERRRRVLAKVEWNDKGLNRRFVVTSFRRGKACELFDLYEDRGRCENYIKELKNGLRADRLSCHSFMANAFRLMLHSLAYVLVHNFRLDVLKRTELACATIETIRLKLFKVGALVKETVRRVWFHLSSGWPFRPLFIRVCKNLGFNTS